MDSITINIEALKRRLILMIGMLVAITTLAFANPGTLVDSMPEDEAQELILKVKKDLDIEDRTVVIEFDEDGNIISDPIKTIKIYDENNELLLEAPIKKIEELNNKSLSKLINASDFLIENHNVKYYRLKLK